MATKQKVQLYEQFQAIATKIKNSLQGNGFYSKDPAFGIECITAKIPVLAVSQSLGLELTQVAHSTTSFATIKRRRWACDSSCDGVRDKL